MNSHMKKLFWISLVVTFFWAVFLQLMNLITKRHIDFLVQWGKIRVQKEIVVIVSLFGKCLPFFFLFVIAAKLIIVPLFIKKTLQNKQINKPEDYQDWEESRNIAVITKRSLYVETALFFVWFFGVLAYYILHADLLYYLCSFVFLSFLFAEFYNDYYLIRYFGGKKLQRSITGNSVLLLSLLIGTGVASVCRFFHWYSWRMFISERLEYPYGFDGDIEYLYNEPFETEDPFSCIWWPYFGLNLRTILLAIIVIKWIIIPILLTITNRKITMICTGDEESSNSFRKIASAIKKTLCFETGFYLLFVAGIFLPFTQAVPPFIGVIGSVMLGPVIFSELFNDYFLLNFYDDYFIKIKEDQLRYD